MNDFDDVDEITLALEADEEETLPPLILPEHQRTPETLDPVQRGALRDAVAHTYTDISGSAGVGKTFVARRLADEPGTKLAATTGIAAVNLGEGTTINALLKYFDTRSLQEAYQRGHLQSVLRKLRRTGMRRIVIDEKSMLSGQQLTLLARAVHELNEGKIEALDSSYGVGENDDAQDADTATRRERDLPPIGITLVGDFGQLPPVPDEDPLTGKKIPLQFAFDSPEWPRFAEHRTVLEKIYRQDAKDFVAALHAVRKGNVQRALEFFTPERFAVHTDDAFEGTTIFAKNDEVERYNLLRLDALRTPQVSFATVRKGKPRPDWKLIPDFLKLKEGALVMILANRRMYADVEDGEGVLIYANGDLGTLEEVDATGWIVRLQRTGQTVKVLPIVREHTVPLEPGRKKEIQQAIANGLLPGAVADYISQGGKGKEEVIGTITYMPLRAAYGTTTHKSQGLTLNSVQVNLRDPFFKHPGLLFVALSRCRTAEGLRIVGDQRGFAERCKMEARCVPWL